MAVAGVNSSGVVRGFSRVCPMLGFCAWVSFVFFCCAFLMRGSLALGGCVPGVFSSSS